MKTFKLIMRHVFLAILSFVWLIPIFWLVFSSFSGEMGINTKTFFPKTYSLEAYKKMLFASDSVSQFPTWFKNTFVVAIFTCIISTLLVLMVAYAMSCIDFKNRKRLMNLSVIVNLFPGVLAMIAVYFVLKNAGLTNSHVGLVMVYSGSAGLGYLIA